MFRKQQKIRKVFVALVALDVIFITITPFFSFRLFNLSEQISETGLIIFLFLLIAIMVRFYIKEMNNYKEQQENLEERLRETFKYIGSINLQLEEMKKVFSSFNKYPESKKDVHALFAHTAERILGIINADWVLLRIVDLNTNNTLHEFFVSRGNKQVERIKLENRALLDGTYSPEACSVIKSNQDNFNIKAYCVLPIETENKNQKFLINSIINQLEMFFIIFNSLYFKRSNDNKKII